MTFFCLIGLSSAIKTVCGTENLKKKINQVLKASLSSHFLYSKNFLNSSTISLFLHFELLKILFLEID